MAAKIITPEWLAQTKAEILGLPNNGSCPRDNGVRAECLSGIQGVYLGVVDNQKVWAVDADAIMVKYDEADFCVAGNHMRWNFCPADMIFVDWSYSPVDASHDLLHETVETRLMVAGWSYARAHKYANYGPGCEIDWLMDLRPEFQALVPEE